MSSNLGADGAQLVALLHVDVALEQVEHGKIRSGFAIGHRGTFEHPPPREMVGMDNSYTRRDFPTPASPTMATIWPWPVSARANACCSASSSIWRPTKRVSPRVAAAWKRRQSVLAPTSSNTSTGPASPR